MSNSRHVRFGVLTDLHLAEPGTPDGRWINVQPLGRSGEILTDALHRLAEHEIDALLLLGDLTDRGTTDQLEYLCDLLAPVRIPVWAVAGNHDLYDIHPEPVATAGLRTPSTVPTGDAVVLDAGLLVRDGVDGTFHETILPKSDCRPVDRPTVWLSHFPVLDLRSTLDVAGMPFPGELVNRQDVHAALRRTAPTVVLAGHLHVHVTVTDGSILHLNHASLIEQPHAYTVLDVTVEDEVLDVSRNAHTFTPSDAVPVDPFLCRRHERWHWSGHRWSLDR